MGKLDRNAQRVAEKLLRRSKIGTSKYGTTTERQDYSHDDWLVHLQDELLDAAVYIEALLRISTGDRIRTLLHRLNEEQKVQFAAQDNAGKQGEG